MCSILAGVLRDQGALGGGGGAGALGGADHLGDALGVAEDVGVLVGLARYVHAEPLPARRARLAATTARGQGSAASGGLYLAALAIGMDASG